MFREGLQSGYPDLIITHSCTARSSFFTERVVNIWNSLPVDTDPSSLSGFIRQINRMDFLEFRCITGSF